MRWCDRWLGKPFAFLVWLLSLFRRRYRSTESERVVPRVKRIVIIKIFGMGSLLLGTPAFRALREAYPGASLEIVSAAGHLPFLQSLRIFDHIHPIPLGGFLPFLRGIIKLLKTPRPDISINLEYYTWFTIALQTLQRARVRVGFAERQWLRLHLLDIPVYFNHHHHIIRIFGSVAEQLGAPVQSYELSPPFIQKEDTAATRKRLEEQGFNRDLAIVAFHIGASPLCPLRQWPLDRFRGLIDLFLTKTAAGIILIGGPDEKEEADAFCSDFRSERRLLNLVGKLSLGETMALLQQSAVLITNDSGPLHWAVALGKPTISFFGPETPDLYGPPPDPRHRVFYSRRYCSPCLTTTYAKTSACRNNLCLQDIGINEVFDAGQDILKREPM